MGFKNSTCLRKGKKILEERWISLKHNAKLSFSLLQIGEEQKGNYFKLMVKFLILNSFETQAIKYFDSFSELKRIYSHVKFIFIVFSNATVIYLLWNSLQEVSEKSEDLERTSPYGSA